MNELLLLVLTVTGVVFTYSCNSYDLIPKTIFNKTLNVTVCGSCLKKTIIILRHFVSVFEKYFCIFVSLFV